MKCHWRAWYWSVQAMRNNCADGRAVWRMPAMGNYQMQPVSGMEKAEYCNFVAV
ncbi:MAG: hypothetical protein Q8S46_02205 [Methylotenera sp.]|nr:hypothetical protein [Methylotenera sp.]MDO9232960.1 hypothetical protein [Methylotenera sp.]MDP1595326.1 hypothetical protein [Methylotenera sp.]MDP1755214.1 hypothetical protein [Methylotenera sp.]MDP1959486.1 hypothetical protein [Methylotenera sp.]